MEIFKQIVGYRCFWLNIIHISTNFMIKGAWLFFCGQTSWLDQRFTILTTENLYFVHGHGQNGYFLVKFCGKILG